MRNHTFRIATSLFLIWALFVMMTACTTEPPKNNSAPLTAEKSNADEVNAGPTTSPSPVPCTVTDLQAEADRGTGDSELDHQRTKGKWNITFHPDSTYGIVMKVSGKVLNAPGQPTKLKKLLQHVDKQTHHMKSGCVGKVVFEALPGTTTSSGFEWSVCYAPNEICETGECKPACLIPTTTPSPGPTASATP